MNKKSKAAPNTDLFDQYLDQYKKMKSEVKGEFSDYNKASYINGFLDGVDLLTGKQVDVYYHGLLAAREVILGEKPTIHLR